MSSIAKSSSAPVLRSRRALIAGALGGLGVWAAAAASRVGIVRAANGDPMEIGGAYTAESSTQISGDGAFSVFYASNDGSGSGVRAHSVSGQAMLATTTHGTAVDASSLDGYALFASGGLRFDRAGGVAKIPAGATSVVVHPEGINVTSASFVLLSPKVKLAGRDLWFTTKPSDDTFTIRMSSARFSDTRVAWLLFEAVPASG